MLSTSAELRELKQTQSSIRERILARKKGLQPTQLTTDIQSSGTPQTQGERGKNREYPNNVNELGTEPTKQFIVSKHSERKSLEDDIENLLNHPSIKERERTKVGNELVELLERQSVKEKSLIEKFKTKGGPKVTEYCPRGTKDECKRERAKLSISDCDKIHFRRIIKAHTDTSLGDCSYLDTCRHMKTCKFVHYEIDDSTDFANTSTHPKHGASQLKYTTNSTPQQSLVDSNATYVAEPQWICCDIRKLDMSLLGQFSVIMADPPWDIHINTLTFNFLIIALTTRTHGVAIWYEMVEEIIWVKTNQLQRIIRTGRTGHWLNHSKEHCLVGVKGIPKCNRFLDCDVIVAEVRETSRKPDEIYGVIERLLPNSRKLELFGRPHNVHPGWLTLGNQLEGVQINDPVFRDKILQHFATEHHSI